MEGHLITSEIRTESFRFEFCKWPGSPFTTRDAQSIIMTRLYGETAILGEVTY